MALIKCQNCGHNISDKAISCPKCGAQNKFNVSLSPKKNISKDKELVGKNIEIKKNIRNQKNINHLKAKNLLKIIIPISTIISGLIVSDYLYFNSKQKVTKFQKPVYEETFRDYLDSSGNCCNEKYYSGISKGKQWRLLDEIIISNPRDSEAFYRRALFFENYNFNFYADYRYFNEDYDFIDDFCSDISTSYNLGNQKAIAKMNKKYSRKRWCRKSYGYKFNR